MSDRRAFRYQPVNGPPQRVIFENTPAAGWVRKEQEWTGCAWRTRGKEPVEDVAFDDSA